MATCGKCHEQGVTVEHVRACYAAKPVPAEAYKPAVLATVVPESRYALNRDGKIVFFEVKRPKTGKWSGFTFVDRLVGHPGDFMRYPVKGATKSDVLAQVAQDPYAAAKAFSDIFVVCACCGSPLSDPESLARGMGPVCIDRFAA